MHYKPAPAEAGSSFPPVGGRRLPKDPLRVERPLTATKVPRVLEDLPGAHALADSAYSPIQGE
jgi:hypothetical protein